MHNVNALIVRIKLKVYSEDGSQATEGRQHAQVSNNKCLLPVITQAATRHSRRLAIEAWSL